MDVLIVFAMVSVIALVIYGVRALSRSIRVLQADVFNLRARIAVLELIADPDLEAKL
jgi:hypothetical protein